MSEMRKVILQVELQPSEAGSLKAVQRKLGITRGQIDRAFGIKPIRPEKNQFAVRVDADVAQRMRGETSRLPEGGAVSVALVH